MRTWLVLAGGESTRFTAGNKLDAPLGSTTVSEATLTALRAADPTAVIRVLGPEFGGGPARAVLAALPDVTTEAVGILAADMPFVGDVISRLCAQWSPETQALVPVDDSGREQWLCAIYSAAALRAAAREVGERRSWRALVEPLDVQHLSVQVPLWDVDTVQDFERARTAWQERNFDGVHDG